ncbi:MAG: hypothetical protein B6U68_03865 [Candidatus Aenigmarchaeota archaeon ex4484_14]|nr:MAG: hypothetical protein B6U68_03865 [Candidatus Aenigmarchaeota archaeon ex4484_14]
MNHNIDHTAGHGTDMPKAVKIKKIVEHFFLIPSLKPCLASSSCSGFRESVRSHSACLISGITLP